MSGETDLLRRELLGLAELVNACALMLESQWRLVEVLVEQARPTPRLMEALIAHRAIHEGAEISAAAAASRFGLNGSGS